MQKITLDMASYEAGKACLQEQGHHWQPELDSAYRKYGREYQYESWMHGFCGLNPEDYIPEYRYDIGDLADHRDTPLMGTLRVVGYVEPWRISFDAGTYICEWADTPGATICKNYSFMSLVPHPADKPLYPSPMKR